MQNLSCAGELWGWGTVEPLRGQSRTGVSGRLKRLSIVLRVGAGHEGLQTQCVKNKRATVLGEGVYPHSGHAEAAGT